MTLEDGTVVCSGTLSGMGVPAMRRRVVVTGLGVVAPNGVGRRGLRGRRCASGRSGIRRSEAMAELGFACQVAGVPEGVDELAEKTFDAELLLAMNARPPLRGARRPRGVARRGPRAAGARRRARRLGRRRVLGTGIGGMDTIASKVVPLVDGKKVRRLGSTAVEQVMASGISARVSGLLALGNQVTTNSSACSTGTEAVIEGMLAHPPRPRRAHALRRRRRREPLHLGGLRRDARAREVMERRAGAGVAADERVAPAASSRRRARACCSSRASRARARAARASAPRCSAARSTAAATAAAAA